MILLRHGNNLEMGYSGSEDVGNVYTAVVMQNKTRYMLVRNLDRVQHDLKGLFLLNRLWVEGFHFSFNVDDMYSFKITFPVVSGFDTRDLSDTLEGMAIEATTEKILYNSLLSRQYVDSLEIMLHSTGLKRYLVVCTFYNRMRKGEITRRNVKPPV